MKSHARIWNNLSRTLFAPALLLFVFMPNLGFGETYGDFQYSVSETNVTITGYAGSGGDVVIPSAIPDVGTVTAIGESAFSQCDSLTGVTIPDSVTYIGNNAFYYCHGLTKVTIPKSVTYIENFAFDACFGLSSACFQGNAPAYCGEYPFYVASSDFTIYYPPTASGWSTPTWDGYPAEPYGLADGGSLEVTIAPDKAVSAGARWQVDGGVWQNSGATVSGLTQGSHTVAFSPVSGWIAPSTQTTIITFDVSGTITATYMLVPKFYYSTNGTNLTVTGYSGPGGAVVIPSKVTGVGTVTSIGDNAFYYCTSLADVVIPDTVTNIGINAFGQCAILTNVTIPDSVISIGQNAFQYCSRLADARIPTNLPNIATNTFYLCINLASVSIPNSVTNISFQAFSGCFSLGSVTIPGSVLSIGADAFNSCGSGMLTNLVISEGVRSIGNGAFYASELIGCLTVPNSVVNLGDDVFGCCDSLTNVTLSTNLTSIKKYTFADCAKLTHIDIPRSVTNIDSYAFQCCGLSSIVISDSVTSIGSGAFYGCWALTNVVIPSSITTISGAVFESCSSLANVEIPESVTNIGNSAFAYCSSLTNVVIPKSVRTINAYAFMNCGNLTSVYFQGDTISIDWAWLGLGDLPSGFTIYYPYSATNWSVPSWRSYTMLPYYGWPPIVVPGVRLQQSGGAITPWFDRLQVGTNYQLQVSTDLTNWSDSGAAFSATNASQPPPEPLAATNASALFFRLKTNP